MSGNKRNFFTDWIRSGPDRTSLIILIITNFVCNNIFLFNLKYYADDWPFFVYPGPKTVSYALLDSQRPLSSAYLVLQQYLTYNVVLFHVLTFVTTTIALVLIYFVFKRIFQDCGFENELYPFIGAMFFCTLFNKDQIYAWPIMSLGLEFNATLLSIYLYLNKEKKYYLIVSMIAYFTALLGYELGVLIPVIFFLYDYLMGKDWKKSVYFAIPLGLYLTIRYTKWFGYGYVSVDRGFGSWNLGIIINSFQYPIITCQVFLNNLFNSVYGYAQMDIALIAALCIINIVLLFIIYRHLKTFTVSKNMNIKLVYVAILMIIAFWAPYIIAGWDSLPTRGFYLCDIGIALLLVCILMVFKGYVNIKILALGIIVLGIFVNQGLYYNWVVCGDTLGKIDHFLEGNSDKLIQYDYVYFNTLSFTDIKPEKYPWATLVMSKFKKARNALFGPPARPDKQYDYGYATYFNALALPRPALEVMIKEQRKTADYTLIYGHVPTGKPDKRKGAVPIDVTKDNITYKLVNSGKISTVSRDKVFEINYSSVVGSDQSSSAI